MFAYTHSAALSDEALEAVLAAAERPAAALSRIVLRPRGGVLEGAPWGCECLALGPRSRAWTAGTRPGPTVPWTRWIAPPSPCSLPGCRSYRSWSSTATLTPAQVDQFAGVRARARIDDVARERNAAAERLVRELLDRGELLYGTSTGVGALRSSRSTLEDAGDHQWRLLRSHAGGGGAPLTVEVVRAAMVVRANQIGAGGAGVGEARWTRCSMRCGSGSRRLRASSARWARGT